MVIKKKKKTTKKVIKRPTPKKKISRKKTIGKRKIKAQARIKKPVNKKIKPAKKTNEKIIGIITHYFPKVRAAVIKLKMPLATGDTIKIKGHTTDFTQTISSMQLDHIPVDQAKKGQEIGLLVQSRARQHDLVLKAKA